MKKQVSEILDNVDQVNADIDTANSYASQVQNKIDNTNNDIEAFKGIA